MNMHGPLILQFAQWYVNRPLYDGHVFGIEEWQHGVMHVENATLFSPLLSYFFLSCILTYLAYLFDYIFFIYVIIIRVSSPYP